MNILKPGAVKTVIQEAFQHAGLRWHGGGRTIRAYNEICNMTFGKDHRTYDLALSILHEETEHEAWLFRIPQRRPVRPLPPRSARSFALRKPVNNGGF